jgi:hypothetical protein
MQNADTGEVKSVALSEAMGLCPPWWQITDEDAMREQVRGTR